MRFIFPILLASLSLALACVDARPGSPSDLHPYSIALHGEGRIHYELTGPDFDDPHRAVGDVVWAPGMFSSENHGEFLADWAHPAPFVVGSKVLVAAPIVRHDGEPVWLDATAHVVLRSSTTHEIHDEFRVERRIEFQAATENEGAMKAISLPMRFDVELPQTVDLWRLEIDWELDDGSVISRGWTSHAIPTSLYGPLDAVPVYRETALWGAKWVAELAADTTDHEIAWALTRGIRTLEREGYSYGGFDRPDKDEIVTKADVFIDHDRSACGEFRGLLMALLEFHGIDAKWVWFKFEVDDNSPDAPPYRAYKTRSISAVGRETQHWFNTNHSIVGVGDRVYDPTYTVWKPTWQEYEDWMFVAYCWGEGDEPDADTCVKNPRGYDVRTLGFNRYVSDSLK